MLMAMTLSVIAINSCIKEIDFKNDENGQNLISRELINGIDPMTTDKITKENGMLVFDTYATFSEVIKALKSLSADSLYYLTVYQDLGYNLLDRNNKDFIEPENVVLEKFENRFSFHSLRKTENDKFHEFLRLGNEPEEFTGSFIFDEFFQAVLNSDYEVKIGDYYFKYVDGDNIAVVSDGDFMKIDRLKGKSIFEIEDDINLHVFNTSDPSCPKFVNRNDDGLGYRFTPTCIVGFDQLYLNNNWFWFTNKTFVPADCGESQYKWVFSDGYVATTKDCGHQFAGDYPYTVTLYVNNDCCNTSCTYVVDLPKCNADFTYRFRNELFGGNSQGNRVYFFAKNNSDNVIYDWDFGDGTKGSGKIVNHLYELGSYDSYIVTLTVTAKDGSCNKSNITKIIVSCGHVYAINSISKYFDDGNQKLVGKIWCKNNLIYETVGANSKSYHKFGGYGPWIHSTEGIISVDLNGDFLNTFNNECISQDINISDNGIKKTAEVFAEDHVLVNEPRFLQNRLTSTHGLGVGQEPNLAKFTITLKN